MEKAKVRKIINRMELDFRYKGTAIIEWCVGYILNDRKGTVLSAWAALGQYAHLYGVKFPLVWRQCLEALTAAGLQQSPVDAIEQFAALCKLEGLKYES